MDSRTTSSSSTTVPGFPGTCFFSRKKIFVHAFAPKYTDLVTIQKAVEEAGMGLKDRTSIGRINLLPDPLAGIAGSIAKGNESLGEQTIDYTKK